MIGLILLFLLLVFSFSISVCVSVCSHIGHNSAASFQGNVSFLVKSHVTPNHEIYYNFDGFFTNTLPQLEFTKLHKYSGTNPDFTFIFTEPAPLFFFQERCMYGLGFDRLMYSALQ